AGLFALARANQSLFLFMTPLLVVQGFLIGGESRVRWGGYAGLFLGGVLWWWLEFGYWEGQGLELARDVAFFLGMGGVTGAGLNAAAIRDWRTAGRIGQGLLILGVLLFLFLLFLPAVNPVRE
ncbi:MAG: hypothetical protein N2C14_21010, partial [Planctomycetales bacterium]